MRTVQLFSREEKNAVDNSVKTPDEAIAILAEAFTKDAVDIRKQSEKLLIVSVGQIDIGVQVEIEHAKYLGCTINTSLSAKDYRKLPSEKRAMIANAANLDITKHIHCYALPDQLLLRTDFLFSSKKMLLHLTEKRFNGILKSMEHVCDCYFAIHDAYEFECKQRQMHGD